MSYIRVAIALLLMIAGAATLVRGIAYSLSHEVGWYGTIMSTITGGLMILLGWMKWHYFRSG